MKVKQITCKLGNMRKAKEWVVYPMADVTIVQIQCDTRICQFNPGTGAGVLSANRPNGAYGHHLAKFLGATDIVVPQDVIDMAVSAIPKAGDEIGPGVYIG